MKARDLIGRRIVGVNQRSMYAGRGRPKLTVFDLQSIDLDNGARLVLNVAETDGDYAIEATVHRARPPCHDEKNHPGACTCRLKPKGE